MKQAQVTIINKLGLHIRACNVLVSTAQRFSSKITLNTEKKSADAKSIMDLMMLGASKGVELTIKAEGEDEDAACDKVVELINNRFGEAE